MALAQFCDWENHPLPAEEVPLAALLAGGPDSWREKARQCIREGARTLKIKIQPGTAGELPEFLRWLAGEFPETVRIRLDANRSMEFGDFMGLAEALQQDCIEFVEEPLREFHRLPECIRGCPLPIALDETLRKIEPGRLDEFHGAAALVFKPTLMGGWDACAPFAEIAERMGALCILSACFESGLGIAALAQLALRHAPQSAAGLDTYSFLAEDLLRNPLDFSGFRICNFSMTGLRLDERKLD
jgi:O-succinylbenzoate synthase